MTVPVGQPPSDLDSPGEGAHFAVLCADPGERQNLLATYLAGAVRRGENAVCVTAEAPEELRARVARRTGGDPAAGVDVVPTVGSYLHDGRFSGEFMLGWLAELAAQSPIGSTEPRGCIAGVLDWVDDLDPAGYQDLFRYESTLNLLAPTSRHSLACFYDLARLPAAEVVNVMRAHPRLVVSGQVWNSPFYDDEDLRPLPLPDPGGPAGGTG
ncbi:MAG TPA: MEDS domain-containing protein [Sporichthyaceae bacterium]|jgi:hypothetical protein|nr:MEDS domain-containing protein [Sporichthyaceae bacterium]